MIKVIVFIVFILQVFKVTLIQPPPPFLSVFLSFNWHQSAGSRCKHLTVLDKRFREKNTKSIWLKQLHLLLHLNKTTMVMEAIASMAIIDHQFLLVKTLSNGKIDSKVTFFVKMVTYGT